MSALAAFIGNAFIILGALFLSFSGTPEGEVSQQFGSARTTPAQVKILPILRQEETEECAAYGCDVNTENPELCDCLLEAAGTNLLRQAACDIDDCTTKCDGKYPRNEGAVCRSGQCYCLVKGSMVRFG